jgi:hypothetical protein
VRPTKARETSKPPYLRLRDVHDVIIIPGFEVFFVEVDELLRRGRTDLGQVVGLARKDGVEMFDAIEFHGALQLFSHERSRLLGC